MNYLTYNEHQKILEITKRLENLQSPVLRLQAILQFSMIVDTLAIGDSAQPLHNRIVEDIEQIDELQNKVYEYEQQEQSVNGAIEDAPKPKQPSHEEQASTIGSEDLPKGAPAQAPTARAGRLGSSPDELTGSDDVA